MAAIRFHLNDRLVEAADLSPTTTLLRFLRDHLHLTGTKEGCAEGDCGACSVAVLEDGAGGGPPSLRAINSCLVLLPMVQGKRIYTVEALKQDGQHHLVQQTLANELGSQCGYCTPGITMSLLEACYREDLDEPWKLDAQMCGNLCRCTGYRPIRDAAEEVAGAHPEDRFAAALRHPNPEPMALSYETERQRFFTPASFEELWDRIDQNPDARFVAGGTDLSLEVTKRCAEPPALISLEGIAALQVLEARPDALRIGAARNLSDVETFARTSGSSPLERMLRYFGSRQIKNRATAGGNLATASPIGDLAPVLLSLGAELVLLSRSGERRVPLDEFFLAYRKTALAPGEILAFVDVPRPSPSARMSSYKVSKRKELDISTVAAAFYVDVDGAGRVTVARLAYGGMAATPARARTAEAALAGRPFGEAEVSEAAAALARDFTPISDHRGSAWYRAKVAHNLLIGFFHETRAVLAPRLPDRHTATVNAEGQS